MIAPAASLVYVASTRFRRAGRWEAMLRDVFSNEAVVTVAGATRLEALRKAEEVKDAIRVRTKGGDAA